MKKIVFSLALILSLNAKADFHSALDSYTAGDFEQAFNAFTSMAQVGEKRSQFNLAVMYYQGQHVKQNINTAYAWMKLATQGDSASKAELDAFAAISKKVTDLKAAEKQFQQLDQQYSSESLLASLYPVLVKPEGENAFNAKPLKVVAPKFPMKAAQKGITGWTRFQFDIDVLGIPRNIQLVESFPVGVFEKDSLKAIQKWQFEPDVNQSGKTIPVKGAQYTLVYQLEGYGKRSIKDDIYNKNLSEAKLGNATAQFNIGFWDKMFGQRSGVNPNQWLLKSAMQDHPMAQFELGKSLVKGEGCLEDKTKGIEWLTRSAASGQNDAKQLLAAVAMQTKSKESHLQAMEYLKGVEQLNASTKLDYAWLLATSPFEGIANPKKAIELAESFESKKFKDEATLYEIKAAAYAALGDFEEAIDQQEDALDEAEDRDADLETIKQHLALYKVKQVWF